MVRSILESAAAGISDASDRFDRSAAQVAQQVEGSKNAATVQISAAARGGPAPEQNDAGSGSLAGAIVDTRVAKYAFIANLRTLQTGDEISKELNKLARSR